MKTPFIPLLATFLGLSLGSSLSAQAQASCNLITNGDFETHYPAGLSGSINNDSELPNWINAGGSPDFYHTSAPTGATESSNPAQAPFGHFTPYNNSNGSLGLLALQDVGTYFYSEYATQPIAPLATGQYYVSMRVLSASNGQYAAKLGIRLSNGNAAGHDGLTTNGAYSPAAISSTTGTYSNAGDPSTFNADWTLVANQFPVNGSANLNQVTIGDFDASPYTLTQVRGGASWPYGYVYVDNVELYKIPTAGPTNVACTGNGVTIGEGCSIPGASYIWIPSTGLSSSTSLTPTANPTTTTTYTLNVILPNGSIYSSATTVTPCLPPPCPPTHALPICATVGSPVTLLTDITTPCVGDTYFWEGPWTDRLFTSTQLNPTIPVSQVNDVNYWGEYTLTVTHADGSTTISTTDFVPLSIRATGNMYASGGVPVPENSQVCRFTQVTLHASGFGTNPVWTVSSSGVWYDAQVTPSPYGDWTMVPGSPNGGNQSVRYDVTCTTTCPNGQTVSKTFTFYSIYSTSCIEPLRPATDKQFAATAYPNPVNDVLHAPDGATNVILLNNQGLVVQKADKTGQLDVRELPDGLYNIQFQQEGKLINQHIQVKH